MDAEADFVNEVCFEERLRKQTAAHDADVFAFLLFQMTHKFRGVCSDDLDITIGPGLHGS